MEKIILLRKKLRSFREIVKNMWNNYSRIFVVGTLFFVFCSCLFFYVQKNNAQKSLRFGFITDVHCYSKFNKDKNEWEVNWRCSRPMGEFVDRMNNDFDPDFVIENGDFVDGRDRLGEDGFLKAKSVFDKIEAPKFHVLGNHETNSFSKERWREIVGLEKTYYYFDLKGFRFIVLDGNNVYNPENLQEIIDMKPEMEPHSYKGMMDDKQMGWLEGVLSESNDLKKIVFIHEPPLDETIGEIRGDIFVNPKPLRDLFSKNKVTAVFSGHIEEMCDVDVDGVQYFTFQGFHKKSPRLGKEDQYKDKGVFHQVVVTDDEIKIEMFFSEGEKEPYRSIKFNQDTAVCNNSSLPPQD